jgi:hypothetical protein
LLDRFPAARVSVGLLAIAATGTFLLADANSFVVGGLAAIVIGLGSGGEMDVTPSPLALLRASIDVDGVRSELDRLGFAAVLGPMLMERET